MELLKSSIQTGLESEATDPDLWYTKTVYDSEYFNKNIQLDSFVIDATFEIHDSYLVLNSSKLRYNNSTLEINIDGSDNWITINESTGSPAEATRWYKDNETYITTKIGIGGAPTYDFDIAGKAYVDGSIVLRVNKTEYFTEDQTTIEILDETNTELSLDVGDFFSNIFGKGYAHTLDNISVNVNQIIIDLQYKTYKLDFMGMTSTVSPSIFGIRVYDGSGVPTEYECSFSSFFTNGLGTLTINYNTTEEGLVSSDLNISASSITSLVAYVRSASVRNENTLF